MKKYILMLVLAFVVFAAGCAKEDAGVTQGTPITEESQIEVSSEIITEIPDAASSEAESSSQESSEAEQEEVSSSEVDNSLEEYMASLKQQSDSIKNSLANDPLKQDEINAKATELYELWDDALNYLWKELKKALPEDEFKKLQAEQLQWIADKEKAVEEAGKEFEGGSIYQFIVSQEAATITEKRTYELYELLKQAKM